MKTKDKKEVISEKLTTKKHFFEHYQKSPKKRKIVVPIKMVNAEQTVVKSTICPDRTESDPILSDMT